MTIIARSAPSPHPSWIQSANPETFWDGAVGSRAMRYGGTALSHRALAEAQAGVKAELAAMHRAFLSLRTKHNALAPISRLPVEIMTRIFSLVACAERAGRLTAQHPPRKRPAMLGWIKVTFVCRHWRNIALGSPSLWAANISLTLRSSGTKAMIARAKAVPITFEFLDRDAGFDFNSIMAQCITQNLSRTKVLRLDWIHIHPGSILDVIIRPAPLLDTLDIVVGSPRKSIFAFPSNARFLGDDAPQLRHVLLHNMINFPWASKVLQHLVSLRLIYFQATKSPARLEDVLMALQKMKSLQYLTLQNNLPQPADSSTTARVPHLVHLDVRGRLSSCGNLLRHLEVPNTASLDLEMDCSLDDSNDALESFFSAFNTFLCRDGQSTPIPTSDLFLQCGAAAGVGTPNPNFIARAKRSPTTATSAGAEINLLFSHRTNAEDGWSNLSFMMAVCDLLSSAHTLTLSADIVGDDGHEWDVGEWLGVGQRAASLQILRTSDKAARVLCFGLSLCRDARSAETDWRDMVKRPGLGASESLFLPALECLELCDVNFHATVTKKGAAQLRFHEEMKARLMARARAGAPLKKLVLRECHVDKAWVDELREVVVIDWDGRE
ncbi:hypothetical protein BV25DRAFT_1885800 [Artomyces pyxidatus]|uniref:Uncharacterized protein n=1 Tax=Artomyces pyxidatus TaxID=48021 RepID=A0ACB8SZX4_9AGAM|nr:hypothetical protein BV25DRAFT_1885800 [Artomyces pyxidatus]